MSPTLTSCFQETTTCKVFCDEDSPHGRKLKGMVLPHNTDNDWCSSHCSKRFPQDGTPEHYESYTILTVGNRHTVASSKLKSFQIQERLYYCFLLHQVLYFLHQYKVFLNTCPAMKLTTYSIFVTQSYTFIHFYPNYI